MASTPSQRMGPPPRSFAADAHDCIMVEVRTGPAEYKCVARCSAPDGELPSDRPAPSLACPTGPRPEQTGSKRQSCVITLDIQQAPYKPAPGLNRGRSTAPSPACR